MKAKKAGRKVLSVILAATLMLTTFVCFDIGVLFGSAVDTSSAITVSDNDVSNVYFYVPEQIYLEPSLTGYTAQGKYKYQWQQSCRHSERVKIQQVIFTSTMRMQAR